MEGVIFWHVLYIVFQRRFRQDKSLLVDLVHGILEGQLRTAILLVMSEYSTWKAIERVRHDPSTSLNIGFATVAEFTIKIHLFTPTYLQTADLAILSPI